MDEDTLAALETAAARYERSAEELEAAVHHLRVAAQHFREQNVPRGCAHAFAAHGHMHQARTLLDENAVLHASKAMR